MKASVRLHQSFRYLKEFVDAQGSDFKILMLTFFGMAIALLAITPFHVNEYAIFGSVVGVMCALIVRGLTSCRTATEGQEQPHPKQ